MQTALSVFSTIEQGKAQQASYDLQARQAENDARASTIERKRALIETLAAQNVGAASQGRTISSIANLQQEDVRRSDYTEVVASGSLAAKKTGLTAAGNYARLSSLLSAGSQVYESGEKALSLSGGSSTTSTSNWNKYNGTIRK